MVGQHDQHGSERVWEPGEHPHVELEHARGVHEAVFGRTGGIGAGEDDVGDVAGRRHLANLI